MNDLIRKHTPIVKGVALAWILLGSLLGSATAAEHAVKMLNKGEAGPMVFEPAVLSIELGDTVTFLAVDKGHNAESVKGLIPQGAQAIKGKINQEIAAAFDVPGAYLIKCQPHYSMGMAMLIVVGDDVPDLSAIQQAKLPAKVKARLSEAYPAL